MTSAPKTVWHYRHIKSAGDPIGFDPHEGTDQQYCDWAGRALHRHYPGHIWTFESDAKEGIFKLQINPLMGDTLYAIGHHDKTTSFGEMAAWVKEWGGQLLERYALARGAMDIDKFQEVRARTPERPNVNSPIPEGDLRVFDPKPAPELPADMPQDLKDALTAATSPEADAA